MRRSDEWRRRALVSVLVATAITACSTSGPRQTKLMRSTEMTVSAAALRVQVRSLASRFSGLMEEAGEEALQNEYDPVRRRHALIWLTNGIPAMQQALFQPDPLAALLDAWFLVAQMRQYFATAADHGMPERNVEIANSVLDEMESDIKLIIDNAGPGTDYERGRDLVYGYAKNNPIDETFASRRGSTVFLAEFTARAGGSALKSIGSVTETLEDLVARIDINAEYLPKLARWQAMLLIMDQGFDTIGSSVENLAYLELIASEVDRMTPIVEALPALVAEERVAVLEALDAYLSRTLAFVDQQRTTLMTNDVRAEREAVLGAIREERIAVLEAIAEERRIVLEALREERSATFKDLDELMDVAFTREVNKLFIRGLILIALILGGFAAITFLGVRALNRRTD
ncbi:MAG: hypothetical protein KAJ97_05005 [Acidobacteria bacterium]|nr:hypothetical protein [Acidobacteriota bacterium]